MHFVHELTIGGGAVHVAQLLRDTRALGHDVACATLQMGPIGDELACDDKIPVFMVDPVAAPASLAETASGWQANVIHGHTCGGGSLACTVARHLGVLGGETIHSMVAGTNSEADFEVVEVDCLQQMRPNSTLIRWAYAPERFRVNCGRDWARETLGIPPDAYVIGRSGRLDGSKLPDHFVQALARLPACWGLLVGHGPEYENLRNLAARLGCVDRLVMPGFRFDLGDMFAAMDAIVYPTHDESVCAGVHEPLFLQLPVICYPRGGMAETILDRRTGIHAGSVPELVHWVRYLMQYPETGRRLGRAGREMLARNGQDDPVREAERHLALYTAAAARKGINL